MSNNFTQLDPQAVEAGYFARLFFELKMYSRAIDCLEDLAKIQPEFTQDQRTLFSIIFKEAMDPLRHSIRMISSYYNESKSQPIFSDLLLEQQNKAYQSLLQIGNRGLEIIDNYLIPATNDPISKIFFLKIKGDIYRYITEVDQQEDASVFLENAKNSYLQAIDMASNQLSPIEPIRLEVTLNYAVFEYATLKNSTGAISLLESALKGAEECKSDLQKLHGESEESFNRIMTMIKQNLRSWTGK